MEKYFETMKRDDTTHIKVSVSYQLGGWNTFTHRQEERGGYVSIVPVKRQSHDCYDIETYTAYTGCKMCVKQLKRKSKKTVEDVWDVLQESIDIIVSMFEEGRVDSIYEQLLSTDWTPRRKYYVICSDKVWKDNMICVCNNIAEAEMVEERWKSFPDRTNVRLLTNEPKYYATWYKVSDQGSIVKIR